MNFRQYWQELTPGRQATLAIGVGAVALFLAIAIYWVTLPDYAVLFKDLSAENSTAVRAQLETLNIPYKQDPDGKEILVDADQVYDIRMKVMSDGLPLQGVVGFELFDNNDFGMTEFAQRINYQRALQGELTRTILALKEVQSARLHLVLPESSLFQKSSEPKASLTLNLRPGEKLSQPQIRGIQRLVASAVPGLSPEQVTINDDRGANLSPEIDRSTLLGNIEHSLAAKRNVESYYATKAQIVLDRVFQPGTAVATVDVVLNNQTVQRTREDMLPAQGKTTGVIAHLKSDREEGQEESFSNEGYEARGRPRVSGSPASSATEIDYRVGRQLEQVEILPGSVQRMSLGVVLPAGTGTNIEDLKSLLAAAVGLDGQRGDSISVQEVQPALDSGLTGTAVPGSVRGNRPAPEAVAWFSNFGYTDWKSLWISAAIALVLVVLLTRLFSSYLESKAVMGEPTRKLTPGEREEVLRQVQKWLRTEDEIL